MSSFFFFGFSSAAAATSPFFFSLRLAERLVFRLISSVCFLLFVLSQMSAAAFEELGIMPELIRGVSELGWRYERDGERERG